MRLRLISSVGKIPAGVAVLLQRAAQALYGLVTVLTISHFLTLDDQGWYYTFISLAALYTLVDLGLSVILVPMFAHEFHRANCTAHDLGITDKGTAVAELLRRSARWYAAAAAIFCSTALIGGYVYFSHLPDYRLPWDAAWSALVLSSGGLLIGMPFIALVEGAGHVREAAMLRLTQLTVGSAACWMLLVLGHPLWAAVMVSASATLVAFAWIVLRWRTLLRAAIQPVPHTRFCWRETLWPVQWRQAIAWVGAYVTTQIHTPILMQTQGPVIAGQMGFSLTIITMMALLGQSFLVRRIPLMARAAASRDVRALDRMFRRDLLFYATTLVAAAIGLILLRMGLRDTPYSERLLPNLQLAGLLAIVFANQLIVVLGMYLRSFLYEPLTKVNFFAALLVVPAAFWSAHISSGMLILVIFSITLGFTLPWALRIWLLERRRWKDTSSEPSSIASAGL